MEARLLWEQEVLGSTPRYPTCREVVLVSTLGLISQATRVRFAIPEFLISVVPSLAVAEVVRLRWVADSPNSHEFGYVPIGRSTRIWNY